ncbi:glycosyltransferase family 4 protein [Patescibacteria group bacterium]|nr:glycosyltransferase family 4 protein [Patescibacteria group bacterium]
MKIAHIVSTFLPYKGGMGNVCLKEAEAMAKQGHKIIVFTLDKGKRSNTKIDNLNIEYIKPIFRYGNTGFVPNIYKKLKQFDIIHIHWPFIGGADVVILWKYISRSKIPVVVQYDMDLVDTGIRGVVFNIYNTFFNFLFARIADKIIVNSFDYARHTNIKKYLKKYKEKFLQIPHGVDDKRFYPSKKNEELLKKYNIQKQDKVILFVGGLDRAHYFKGIGILIKAYQKLILEYKIRGVKLLIIGKGDLLVKYKKLANKLNISRNIIFTGSVSDESLPDYYNLSDIFVLASTTRSESFGLVLLEAMACQKPVIVSNLPGPRKLVKDNGLVFEINDYKDLARKIKALLKDEIKREYFGEQSLVLVKEKYQWQKINKELGQVYEKIINNQRNK